MGAAEEAVVTAFMSAWGNGTQAEPDVETILSMFTEDVVWQLWVPGGPILRGREMIKADIQRQLGFATHMRCGPLSVVSNDGQVFTERLDRFTSHGVQIHHHLVAVFDISDDGRIAAWREYFDPEDVNRQLRAALANSASKALRSSAGASRTGTRR
jgi:limonene-1,2-epoxide hydrolase